jgi:molecular chaperone HscB
LKEVDFFEFFCIEKKFDLDLQELNQQFKQYQKFIHPDRFQSQDMQDKAHDLSSFENNAYVTLLNDLMRAAYLLKVLYK